MKKFIIRLFASICACVILSSTAFAKVDVVSDELKNIWKFGFGDEKDIKDEFEVKVHSTEYNIQQVDIVAATKIYKNGAVFCRMTFQHNYGRWTVWVHKASCKTICLAGYYGDTCSITSKNDSAVQCETSNLSETLRRNPGATGMDIDGFYNDAYDAVILVARYVQEHSIDVYPVQFDGKANNKIERILNRATKNNFNGIRLCAQGYLKNSNGDCVRDTDICRCPAGQGFESEASDKCIACKETGRSGVDTVKGVCRSCDVGTIFIKTDRSNNYCPTAKALSHEQMDACYMDKDPDKFRTCVQKQ